MIIKYVFVFMVCHIQQAHETNTLYKLQGSHGFKTSRNDGCSF